MLAELLLDGEAETLTRKAIKLALPGDTVALRLCLDRILPPRRERPVRFKLLELASRKVGPPKYQFWLDKGDGLRNNDGITMTRQDFDAAFPNARKITLDIFGNSNRD